jgi:heme/copper-type cytochrome/quinol oxidase subunit 2
MHIRSILFSFLLFLAGCGSSQQFVTIPPGVNREKVAKQTIDIIAERYKFIPEVVTVKEGTLVTLRIKSVEGTHGFRLSAFGIDERIDANETRVIEFYASQKGEYSFRCSHFCGFGHLGMNGKIVVE